MGSDPYMQLISLSLATSMYTFISYGLQPLILIWRLGGHTQLVSALCGDHYTHFIILLHVVTFIHTFIIISQVVTLIRTMYQLTSEKPFASFCFYLFQMNYV